MNRLLLFLIAIFAVGCTTSTEPGTNTDPVKHTIPKVGSTFEIERDQGTSYLQLVAEVAAVGNEEDGHKNVSVIDYSVGYPDQLKISYMDNGDIALTLDFGWVTLPLATKNTITVPEVRREEGFGSYSLTTQSVALPTRATMSIMGEVFDGWRFVISRTSRVFKSSGEQVSTIEHESEVLWSEDLGFPLLVERGSIAFTESDRLTDFELK